MDISLSIGIVTRNRPLSLRRTIESLASQSVQPYEIIISDDSEDIQIIDANKEIASQFKCKYITGPQRGLYANRNFVMKQSAGTHFRSMDDDHKFPDDHLMTCIKNIKSNPDVIWTIGEYNLRTQSSKESHAIPGQLHPRGFSYIPDDMTSYYGISCGATIYPRSVIDKKIFNSECYQFGALYLEYGARLKKNEFFIQYMSDTYILHYDDEHKQLSISQSGDKTSIDIKHQAKIFSMLMLSFEHQKSLKNQTLTIIQIFINLLTMQYSVASLLNAYNNYKKEKYPMPNKYISQSF